MLADLTTLDLVALVLFVGAWSGYSLIFHGRFSPRRSLQVLLVSVREAWMTQLLERDARIVDAHLNGSSIAGASFFASATIIVIAALVGVLGIAAEVHAVTRTLASLVGPTSLAVFELKLFGLIAMFIYAFFCFTWAIRQFSFFSAVIGGAPVVPPGHADPNMAKRMAKFRTLAVAQLNAGLRTYYFALAALGWFIHPAVFIAATLLITLVLVHRQLWSSTARTFAEHVQHLP